jgi:CDP-4-dehydro-6-deoxyglucose reductase
MERPRACTATVEAVRALTPDVLEVDLRMSQPGELPFQAGQWVSVPFGPKVVRAYSMASSPAARDRITLCADVAPGGIGSQWFRGLAPGATVQFKAPNGGFVLEPGDTRRPLFVAEEIGIVPIRSILADVYRPGAEPRASALIYWARDPGWLIYDAEFRALSRDVPVFRYLPALRQAPAGWRGDTGELTDVVDRLVHSGDRTVAYVAGGGETIKRVRTVLVGKGFDRKAVKWEKFW